MATDRPHRHSIWKDLRSTEPRVPVRLGVSLAAAIMLSGFAFLGAYGWARLVSDSYVEGRHVGIAHLIAIGLWLGSLMGIWSRIRSGRFLRWTVVQTAAIAAVTITASTIIAEFGWREDIVVLAVTFLGIGWVILTWVSAYSRLSHGQSVFTSRGEVAVHCPSCGYSLIGLNKLRCPECGAMFTIDQLIRAQGYVGDGDEI